MAESRRAFPAALAMLCTLVLAVTSVLIQPESAYGAHNQFESQENADPNEPDGITDLLVHNVLSSVAPESALSPFGVSTAKDTKTLQRADSIKAMIELEEFSPVTVQPTDTVTVRAQITNKTDQTIKNPAITFDLMRYRFSSRISLSQWSQHGLSGPLGSELLRKDLGADLAPDQSKSVSFTLDAATFQLLGGIEGWGPRGVSLTLRGDHDGEKNARLDSLYTYLLWYSAPEKTKPTLEVAAIVPLTGPAVNPLDTTATRDAYLNATQPSSRLQHVLDAVKGSSHVALAFDPQLIQGTTDAATIPIEDPEKESTASDETDTSTPTPEPTTTETPQDQTFEPTQQQQDSSAWTQQLFNDSKSRELFALPAYDLDPAQYARAGLRIPSTSKASHPATKELDYSTQLVWPTADAMSATVVNTAAQSGSPWVIAQSGSLTAKKSLTYTPNATFSKTTPDGTARVLASDETLSSLITDPETANPLTARQRFISELAVIAKERPSEVRNLVISTPRSWNPDPVIASAQLSALTSLPWVSPIDIGAIAESKNDDNDKYTLRATPQSIELFDNQGFSKLRAQYRSIETLSHIVEDPATFVAPYKAATRAVTSNAWLTDPAGHDQAVTQLNTASSTTLNGISVVTGSDINLISTGSEIPVTVQNDLNQTVNIQLQLRPNDPRLQAKESVPLTIPARSSESARVPVSAVGSGNVVVSVVLLDEEGKYATASGSFNVRVRADWENMGTGVVVALLVLLLGGGILRTVKRSRARRRTSREEAATTLALVEAETEGGPAADTEIGSTHPDLVAHTKELVAEEHEEAHRHSASASSPTEPDPRAETK
ncbi:DUF6049 family protein [Timonella sp. A28]|uniref:DUF6049 family protein n=1 Tax=Timonella sp. A28 TaxID=3442640 RepID=UPI003EBBC936